MRHTKAPCEIAKKAKKVPRRASRPPQAQVQVQVHVRAHVEMPGRALRPPVAAKPRAGVRLRYFLALIAGGLVGCAVTLVRLTGAGGRVVTPSPEFSPRLRKPRVR